MITATVIKSPKIRISSLAREQRKGYRFIDLFAGIGGFHLAFSNVGAECVFASEWDEKARKTYEHNFSKTDPNLFKGGMFAGDITKVIRYSL